MPPEQMSEEAAAELLRRYLEAAVSDDTDLMPGIRVKLIDEPRDRLGEAMVVDPTFENGLAYLAHISTWGLVSDLPTYIEAASTYPALAPGSNL